MVLPGVVGSPRRKRLIPLKERSQRTDRCIICGRNGVDGISVASGLICQDCEERIVNSRSTDPEYDEVLQAVKALWRSYVGDGKRIRDCDTKVAHS